MNNWIAKEQAKKDRIQSLKKDLKIEDFLCSLLLQREVNSLEKAKEFAIKNSDLNYSYYGTNEVLKLTLVFIAHKQNELKLAKKYFLEYETMEETLSANYLKTDFGASKSKKFINEFNTVLNSYGFK